MSGLARYAETLRVPYVARLLGVGALARLPMAMETVAVVLFVRDLDASYALAGAVAAAYTVGYAVAAPVQGRMADRYGPTLVLWPLAIAHAVAMGALVWTGLADLPGIVLVALGLAGGATVPPTGAIVRRALNQLGAQKRELLPSIFALDSFSVEMIFIGGPMVTAVLIVVASPAAALLVACGLTLVGVAGLVSMPTLSRESSTQGHEGPGLLRSPGMRTLIGCVAPVGVLFGAFQVSIIAFADDVDASWSAPWLLALLSVGGALGALAYGAFGHRYTGARALTLVACLLPFCFLPILFASSLALMVPLVVLGGALGTPLISITNQMVGDAAPPGAVTEAYSWTFMSMLVGVSAGLTLGGKLIDLGSWHTGIALAIGSAILTAVFAVSRRRTLPDVGWEALEAG